MSAGSLPGMPIMTTYELQLSDTRNAVWIHASDGSTVGRFGRMGIDLHNTVTEQMAGMPECRLCTHRRKKRCPGGVSRCQMMPLTLAFFPLRARVNRRLAVIADTLLTCRNRLNLPISYRGLA
jgi:hypothetical protein